MTTTNSPSKCDISDISLNTIERFRVGKDMIAYTNGQFKKVSFWGRVVRVLKSILLCDNRFKDCSPKFIAEKMLSFYVTVAEDLERGRRRLLGEKIKHYASYYNLTLLLNKIKDAQVNIANGENSSQDMQPEESIDWDEMIAALTAGRVSKKKFLETLESVDVSSLSREQVIAIQTALPFETKMLWNSEQRTAIQKHFFKAYAG